MKIELKNNYVNITVFLLALLNAALHIVLSYNLEFHRDELLYFSLGQHPAFGYETVPPLIGWIAYLMQSLFGYTIFAVRIFPALLSGLIVLLVSEIARELGGNGYSRILAGLGIVVSGFGLRTFLLFQPVFVDLFLWTLSFYLIIKYINTSSGKYLILFGITAGVALLNKYLIVLLFFLLLVTIPFTRYRSILKNRKFWLGILAGAVIFMPNLIWQALHGFPVFWHLSELNRTQLVNVDSASFLIEQLMTPMAASILTIGGIIFLFSDKGIRRFRFLGFVAIMVVVSLLLMHGKSYYTQGIFPFLIAVGAVAFEKILRKTWSRALLVVVILVSTIQVIPIGIPVYKTSGLISYFKNMGNKYGMDFICRFEDGSIHSLPQDYADMLGWEELVSIADRGWNKIEDKKSAFIYCENYGQAGAVSVIGKKYGLPEAISFNESFKYWIPQKFDNGITSVIYINNEIGDDVKSLFGKIEIIGSISNPDAREYGTTVYLCRYPVSEFNEFWNSRIKQIYR